MVQKDPAVHLLLIGTGPLLAEVRNLVSRMNLERKVTFLEPRPDIPKMLLGAWTFSDFRLCTRGVAVVS